MKDDLFCTNALLATKTKDVALSLVDMEERLVVNSERGLATEQLSSIEKELKWIQGRLDAVEAMEVEAWLLTAHVEGNPERSSRATKWTSWYRQIQNKIQQIQNEIWCCKGVVEPLNCPTTAIQACSHRRGHVEKVRLPQFSGNIKEYAEFKSQFQQLCKGKGYSSVIELAQLRTKLPKDAVTAIVGLTTPDQAWMQLDELYGNKEMSVIMALKGL